MNEKILSNLAKSLPDHIDKNQNRQRQDRMKMLVTVLL